MGRRPLSDTDTHQAPACLPLPAGKRVFGVQDRPAVRVLRYEADAASATASANAQERQAAQPAGRRHAAFYQYIDAVRRNEQRWGLDAMQASTPHTLPAMASATPLPSAPRPPLSPRHEPNSRSSTAVAVCRRRAPLPAPLPPSTRLAWAGPREWQTAWCGTQTWTLPRPARRRRRRVARRLGSAGGRARRGAAAVPWQRTQG